MISTNGKKMIVEAGKGDIIWAPSKDNENGEICHIIFFSDGKISEVGETLDISEIKPVEDWDLKIYLPTKESFASLYTVMQDYAEAKWGEIPNGAIEAVRKL